MNILLLEDESELNQIAAIQLERMGHTVLPALSIREAEVILDEKADHIDCMLADHKLPDGLGIAYCVDCKEKYPHITYAVVSGCLTPDDISYMQESDIIWWEKPVIYSNVIKKIRDIRGKPKSETTKPVVKDSAPKEEQKLSKLLFRKFTWKK